MKLPPTNCPDCNSVQKFSPKKQVTPEGVRFYIICLACRSETTLEILTEGEYRQRRKQIRERNRAIRRSPH